MQKTLQKAFEGDIINDSIAIPYELSPYITLKIVKELFEVELYLAYKKIEYKNSYKREMMDYSDEEYDEIAYEIEMEDYQCKANIFNQFGINANEVEANTFLRHAIRNYRIIDKKFKELHAGLEDEYNIRVSQIMSKTISTEDLEKIRSKYLKYCY